VIDGIKIWALLFDFQNWKARTGIAFTLPMDEDAGVFIGRKHKNNPNIITYTHTGSFETYKLTVKETVYYKDGARVKQTYNLLIEGSLHKNYYGGSNYRRFTFYHLQAEIKKLCSGIHLQPGQCKIQNLEIGVNVKTTFPVKEYIDASLLLHSTKPFVEYDPDDTGFILGRLAKHAQHSVKCYDKGMQNKLNYELMRIEDRCIKMQYLSKFGIKTLQDLTNYNKVAPMGNLLLSVWDDVLVQEPDIDIEKLDVTAKQKKLLNDGQYRDFWTGLLKKDRKRFDKQRPKFRGLMAANSSMNTYRLIRGLIKDEWATLIKKETNLPGVKTYTVTPKTGGDIFTVRVKGKNVPLQYYNEYVYY